MNENYRMLRFTAISVKYLYMVLQSFVYICIQWHIEKMKKNGILYFEHSFLAEHF